MEYRLGICDEDYHYVVNLMEYVNSCEDSPIKLVAFSSPESLEEYLGKYYLDGVLIGEGLTYVGEYENVAIVRLTDAKTSSNDEIYKYQSAEDIISCILKCLNVCAKREIKSDKSYIAVYSPLGRCGKTSLAKALGLYYPNTLYIAMEEYGRRDSYGEDIFYHILLKNHNITQLIDKLEPNNYGLTELKGILCYLDIRQLEKDNLEWFKEVLATDTIYDKVVFDIGSGSLGDILILDAMDVIYVPVLEDDSYMIKLHAFRELLRRKEYQGIMEKLVYVHVPECHYASDAMRDFIKEGDI